MHIDLHITADSFAEIRAGLAGFLNTTAQTTGPVPSVAEQVAAEPVVEISAPAKKRGRPAKTDQPVTDIGTDGEPVNATGPTESAQLAPEVKQPTVEEARDVIKALFAKTDENTTHELLTKYGAKSASTLVEGGKGAEFIAEANALIAKATV